jgi:hypothetical protein
MCICISVYRKILCVMQIDCLLRGVRLLAVFLVFFISRIFNLLSLLFFCPPFAAVFLCHGDREEHETLAHTQAR